MSLPMETRIARLEQVLGIDASTSCKGDPELCGNLCTTETCPTSQNVLFQLLEGLARMQSQIDLLQTSVEEIVLHTDAVRDSSLFQQRVQVKTQLVWLRQDRALLAQDLDRRADVPYLLEGVKETLAAMDAEIDCAQKALERLQ